ncbi:(2Fe-2S)-binding protein [Actinomadura chibensis]|uniref:Bacterioferritin-associated ferredoxin n=1 Tax=Actinomadura chibensis TaxID=392828 RepID=A0A5D0NVF4_9ACTN|nr:(2Fe-2S)-binding protein [Actinomadura chibensis]TYB48375.1 (2Fe-2S)-binding protein [Actinomadura chibensis]
MYVCICNAVTEDDVNGCMASGCATAKEVKAACGFKPGCGSCTKRLHRMVSEYRTASELADALTGGPAQLTAVPEPDLPEPGTSAPPTAEPLVSEAAEGGAAPPTAA